MANPTITINATGITVSGPLIAGEPVAVTASGLSLPEGAALTLALSSRAPNALLASCVLAESEETPGTWTGTLETASRQMAVYFATAAADDTRPAVLELVETTTRDSLALLVTSIRNSALIPSSSPCAVAPVYIPVPGPPGDPQPSDATPLMDGAASPGISADYSRADHQHPTDTSRMAATATGEDIPIIASGVSIEQAVIAVGNTADSALAGLSTKQDIISDLATIRSGAAAGATAVQPADLATVATTGNYNDLTNKPTIPAAQVQSDWNQTNAAAVDFIKNKPTIPGPAPSPSTATPPMDGTGAAGAATTYARGDHVHPTDTSRAADADALHNTAVNEYKHASLTFMRDGQDSFTRIGSSFSGNRADYIELSGAGGTIYHTSEGVQKGQQRFTLPAIGGEFVVGSVVRTATVGNSATASENVSLTPDANGSLTIPLATVDESGGVSTFRAGAVVLEGVSTSDARTGHACTPAYARSVASLRYSFASPTPGVAGSDAMVACEDRSINDFTVPSGVTRLGIGLPAAVTGRARDFFCRVTLTDSSLPTVTLPAGQTVDIGQSEINGMTQGVNLLMFTEIASGHWLASRRSAS